MARVVTPTADTLRYPTKRRRLKFDALRFAPLLSTAIILIIWEGAARSGFVTTYMLPPFSMVMARIWHDTITGELLIRLSITLYRTLLGFAVAAVLGVAIGLSMWRYRVVNWFFDPIISVGFPMPKIAFLPVIILWLGVYDASKITMIVIDAVFPVIAATVAGARGVDTKLFWSARSLGANNRELAWQIALPAAFPQIMTGLQVSLPIAMILAIVVGMMMGGQGLGGAMIYASRGADSVGVFANLVVIGLAGFCLMKGFASIRRRLLGWHPESLPPTTV